MATIGSNILKEKAITINNILSEYIQIHDSFIKSSNSILSIFRPINFQKLSGETYLLFEKLRDERKSFDIFKSETMNSQHKAFKNFIDDLVFCLYFNLDVPKDKISDTGFIKSLCQKNKFYPEIEKSL